MSLVNLGPCPGSKRRILESAADPGSVWGPVLSPHVVYAGGPSLSLPPSASFRDHQWPERGWAHACGIPYARVTAEGHGHGPLPLNSQCLLSATLMPERDLFRV